MRRIIGMATAVVMVVSACERSPVEPSSESAGIGFTANGTVTQLSGAPASSLAAMLQQQFVIARADSVGGFAVIGYEVTGEGTGDLLVLQAPRATGTVQCGLAEPCHGRLITGVQHGSTAAADRYFHAESGSITVTQVGPDRLRGTFQLTLRAQDGRPDATIVVENGTIDVPYVSDEVTDGSLACLLALVGIGIGPCAGSN